MFLCHIHAFFFLLCFFLHGSLYHLQISRVLSLSFRLFHSIFLKALQHSLINSSKGSRHPPFVVSDKENTSKISQLYIMFTLRFGVEILLIIRNCIIISSKRINKSCQIMYEPFTFLYNSNNYKIYMQFKINLKISKNAQNM
jgi:hypothetical protein